MSSDDAMGPDATRRGVDIAQNYRDVGRIAAAWFREPRSQAYFRAAARAGKAGRRLEVEDFVQDVCMCIMRRNNTASAYDPARGSLSKYVRQTCFSVATHGTDRAETEAPLDDPARWGYISAVNDNLAEGVRAYVSQNEAALGSLAREIDRDAAKGQGRLFAVEVEFPALAGVL